MWFKEVTSSITWCHPYLLSESGETLVFLLNLDYLGAPLETLRQVRLLRYSSTPRGAWVSGAAHSLQAGVKASLSLPLSSMSPQNPQASSCLHKTSLQSRTSFPWAHIMVLWSHVQDAGSPASPASEQMPGELTTALVVILGKEIPYCVWFNIAMFSIFF